MRWEDKTHGEHDLGSTFLLCELFLYEGDNCVGNLVYYKKRRKKALHGWFFRMRGLPIKGKYPTDDEKRINEILDRRCSFRIEDIPLNEPDKAKEEVMLLIKWKIYQEYEDLDRIKDMCLTLRHRFWLDEQLQKHNAEKKFEKPWRIK